MFGSFTEPFNFNLNVRKLVVRNFNISPRLAATNVACVWKIGKYTQIIRVPRPLRHLLCDLRHQLHAPAAESSRLDREPVNAQTQSANCLHLNLSKTTEMVFRQPRITYFHLPPAVGDIEQVNCCKLLGVIFQSNLKMDSHVHYISVHFIPMNSWSIVLTCIKKSFIMYI